MNKAGSIFAVVIVFTITSCATTGGGGKTAPEITLTDYRAQNVERIRDGVIGLVREDSGGTAAREYIKSFEDDLSMRIPTQAAMPAATGGESIAQGALYCGYSTANLELLRLNSTLQLANESLPRQQLMVLKNYLDGRKVEAIGDLMEQSTVFASGGGTPTAKLGLAASYIAIACANQPGDIETVVKLVDPLLTHLKLRK